MKAKTIIIIILTALVTIILMKNADEVEFWIFGTYLVPKLAVLATMFVLGVVVGLMLRKPKSKQEETKEEFEEYQENPPAPLEDPLDEEDQDYIR